MTEKPGWRERLAPQIEAGKQQRAEQVQRLSEELAEYEQRLKERRRLRKAGSFKRDEPSHTELSQPKEEDDDLW